MSFHDGSIYEGSSLGWVASGELHPALEGTFIVDVVSFVVAIDYRFGDRVQVVVRRAGRFVGYDYQYEDGINAIGFVGSVFSGCQANGEDR